MIRHIGKLSIFLALLAGSVLLLRYEKDPCIDLQPCEQYKCLNPKFYCAQTLYQSNIRPVSIEDAQKIVMEYIDLKLGLSAEIIAFSQMNDPYKWYQITCHLSDGSQYGYEVGPDGNIYEIKHLN